MVVSLDNSGSCSVLTAIPREQPPPESRQQQIGAEAEDPDHHDGCIDVVEMLVACLLGDEPCNAGAGADQFGHNQVGPCPAEQDALVAIQIGQYPRHDDPSQQAEAPRTQRQSRLKYGCVKFARSVCNDQHLLEESADDDDGNLGTIVDAEHSHCQRAECRRRQVAEELDERLVETAEGCISAGKYSQGNAEQGGDHEPPKNDLDAVPQAFVQPWRIFMLRDSGKRGIE